MGAAEVKRNLVRLRSDPTVSTTQHRLLALPETDLTRIRRRSVRSTDGCQSAPSARFITSSMSTIERTILGLARTIADRRFYGAGAALGRSDFRLNCAAHVLQSDNMRRMELNELLADVRRRAGLSLRALAAAAGTSAPTLHAYEHGTKEPSLSVARRIVRAAGFDLDVRLAATGRGRGPTSDEAFKLELDRLIAEHLIDNPRAVLAVARRNLDRARVERPVHEQGWISEWETILGQPLIAIVGLLLADDAESLHLKQTSPFAGVLSQAERVQAMERVRARRSRVARAS